MSTSPHRSILGILLSWTLLWRWLAAFLIPYGLFSILGTAATEGVNEALGQLPPPRVALVNQKALPQALSNKLRAVAELRVLKTAEEAQAQVETDSCDIALVVQQTQEEPYIGQIKVYYNSMRNVRAVREVFEVIRNYEQGLIAQNLEPLALEQRLVDPIAIEREDVFSPFTLLGKVVDSAKGIVSNVFNFLLIFLVCWLARQLILRIAIYAPRSFWLNLATAILGTALGSVLVFWGVQVGLDIEQSGMLRRILVILQELIVIDELWPILVLWVPTWLFILGVLGSLTMGCKARVDAYGRTFWMVAAFHVFALYACKSAAAMKAWMLWVPIFNVFQLGQLNLKGNLDMGDWTMALVATSVWAVLLLLLWRLLLGRSTVRYEKRAL